MAYTKIRDLREDADLTQAQMAKVLNCSQQAYSNYELGQRDIPTDIRPYAYSREVSRDSCQDVIHETG